MSGGTQGLRRELAVFTAIVLVLAAASAAQALPAAAAAGTPVCGVVAGSWNALGSPYMICASGVTVASATTLTLDGLLGAVQVNAQGQGGVAVDGSLLTANTSATAQIHFDGPGTAAGSWNGIGGGVSFDAPPNNAVINLAYVTIAHPISGVSAQRVQTVILDHVTVTSTTNDAIYADAHSPSVTNTVVTGSGGSGIRVQCHDASALTIADDHVDGAALYGIRAETCVGGPLQRNLVTNSGHAAPGVAARPAILVDYTDYTLGPSRGVDANTGSGNGVDAIELQGRESGGFPWVTPTDSNSAHALGYLVEGTLTVKGPGTVTAPAGAVIKGGGLELDGADFDATAGGLIFTSFSDDSVGPPTCLTALPPACHQGESLNGTGLHGVGGSRISLTSAEIRNCDAGVSGHAFTLTMLQSRIHDCRSGVITDNGGTATMVLTGDQVDHIGDRGVDVASLSTSIASLQMSDIGWWALQVYSMPASGPISLVTSTFTRAGDYGVRVFGDNPLVQENAVTSSDSGKTDPAIDVRGNNLDIGGGRRIDGNVGGGNGLDAMGLSGSVASDLLWISPSNSSSSHPLGYVLSSSTTMLPGKTLVVPAGGMVKVRADPNCCGIDPALTLHGAVLDASAGNATFTTTDDDSVGPPTCGPNPACGSSPTWTLVIDQDSTSHARGNASIYGATIRGATMLFSSGATSSPLSTGAGLDIINSSLANSGVEVTQSGALLIAGSTMDGAPHTAVSVSGNATISSSTISNSGGAAISLGSGQLSVDHTAVHGNGAADRWYGVSLGSIGTSASFNCVDITGNYGGILVQVPSPPPGPVQVSIAQSNLFGNLGPSARYDLEDGGPVTAEANWWGQAGGPAPGQVSNSGNADTAAPLSGPSGCAPQSALPRPAVTGVSPMRGPTGGGTSVQVTGSGFNAGTTTCHVTAVHFGATAAAAPGSCSDSSVTVSAPFSFSPDPIDVDVTITTPGGTSPTTEGDRFHYTPRPTVTSVSPASGAVEGGTRVGISGTGFEDQGPSCDVSSVSFGSSVVTTFETCIGTSLILNAPAQHAGDPRTVDVRVTTGGGRSNPCSCAVFTYGVPLHGYNILTGTGAIYSFGDATYWGNLLDHHYPGPAIGLAETPDGQGYDILTTFGGIYTFGNGQYYGNLIDGGHPGHAGQFPSYPGPATALAYTPSGGGYVILNEGGGLYSFGDANGHYYGNLIDGGVPHQANFPANPGNAVSVAFTASGNGYWILADNGAIYSFGDADYYGNLIDRGYPGHATSLTRSSGGAGYLILTKEGGIYSFGDSLNDYSGNLLDHHYPGPGVAFSATP